MNRGSGRRSMITSLGPLRQTRRPLSVITAAALVAATLAGACGADGTPGRSEAPLATPLASAFTGPSAPPPTSGGWVCLGGPCPSDASAVTPVPAGPPTPTAGPETANVEGYRAITLPRTGVRTVPLVPKFMFHRLDSDGPLVVLDESGGCRYTREDGTVRSATTTACRSILLVDLQAGTFSTLQRAPEGWITWLPAISGRRVAWLEYHMEGPLDTGPLDWRVLLADLDAGTTRVVDSGVQRDVPPGATYGASWPELDLDGDRLAYAIEDPAHGSDGWKIVVRSVSTGAVEREVATELPVYDLALDGPDVAWSEGRIDPDIGFTYDTRLMVSMAARPGPRKVADHAYEVDFDAGRLAWGQDTPVTVTGAAQHTRIWTATVPDFEPEPASPIPQQGIERYQAWPQTGSGFVTWESYRFSEADISLNADMLCFWNPADGHAYEVNPTRGADLTSSDGGWFVWTDLRLETPTVSGIPISELLP